MIDIGISKIALIGAVALIVIGPDKLPRLARTIGALLGKAQRYVADVKAEVNRSIDLDELRKMKDSVETAARDVETAVHETTSGIERDLGAIVDESTSASEPLATPVPEYKNPGKNWRLKQGAMPQWYKARAGVRRHVLSGAARVARYRPKKFS
ncbi:MAG: twin-arginine translocase TatA/TatE family subunit [Ramlibacter sp.]|uniref:Sec-independent protein translocase subunit TatA/TatB n=1 Tax=Ramlibacter sp. TaxID=1917967 RepID=UPI002632EA8E|nr:twin-arginine translocase TatA/TatE family subunit [Ramlibacter sp.]MDH4375155.1 twin-arginine translocase TatA/TatE family subunit [Ramlibacter sp.]